MFLKPTTPTSAGLAQVFDTSGLVQYAYQERQRRQERLQKNVLEYDPSKMWDKHIPEYQARYSELEEFVSTNHQKLLNATDNMDIWREYKAKQNDIKNFVAIAAQDQTNSQEGLRMLANEKYSNTANEELIDAKFNKQIGRDFYKDPDWALDPRNAMRRNIDINYQGYSEFLTKNISEKITGLDPERMKRAKSTGVDLFAEQTNLFYDREKAKEALRQDFTDDADIQYKYGDDEAGLEQFTDDVLNMVRREDASRAMQISKGRAGAAVTDIISQGIREGDEAIVRKVYTIPGETRKGKITAVPGEAPEDLQLHAKRGSIAVYPPDLKLRAQFDDVMSLDTGEMVDMSKKYEESYLLSSATMRRATKEITLTGKDGKKYAFQAGEYIPDIEDNTKWSMTSQDWKNVNTSTYDQKTATMMAGVDAIHVLQELGRRDVDLETIKAKYPGTEMILVPYSRIRTEANNALSKKKIDLETWEVQEQARVAGKSIEQLTAAPVEEVYEPWK